MSLSRRLSGTTYGLQRASGQVAASMATAESAVAPGGAAAGDEAFTFPGFRSEEWIRKEFDSIQPPSEVLKGADLMPSYIREFPTSGLYPGKVAAVQLQIRQALFRQALFKVQNTEVTYMDECKDLRVLRRVVDRGTSPPLAFTSLWASAYDRWNNLRDTSLLREELWSIDRCGQNVDYHVRFYKEGGNGFSASVFPTALRDVWNSLKYYNT